jgi:hypothetical protein
MRNLTYSIDEVRGQISLIKKIPMNKTLIGIFYPSGWADLNRRPLVPQTSTLNPCATTRDVFCPRALHFGEDSTEGLMCQ